MFTADAAHMSWLSSTMYFFHDHDIKMSAICIAHGIVSGYEDESGWMKIFPSFIQFYPFFNQLIVTDISNRDKGLPNAINTQSYTASGFYRSRHKFGNIAGRYGKAIVDAFNLCLYTKTKDETLQEKLNLTKVP